MNKVPSTTIIEPPSGLSLELFEIWEYRELLFALIWRDIKVKYNQTFLGLLWVIIQPIMLMVVFIFFLSRGLSISTAGMPPALFYLSGLIAWSMFNKAILGAGNSIIYNADIIGKIYFPRIILPLSNIISALFDFIITFILYLMFVLYFGIFNIEIHPIIFISYSFAGTLLLFMSSFGIGTFLASINIEYRDASYILPFLLQLLFFISPIIYAVTSISETWVKYLMALNPLTGTILLLRGPFNNIVVDSTLLAISCASAALIFLTGIFNFKRKEPYFAEMV